ncbi:multiple epidermal growth factor-like domains protein 10 isoform X1 [Mya arenaria]|uniref:multiple epidermal growth factor-like domains protein 10 isoform X1 n=1 Tax=Mya arenaria TaxID=6604 RepID=UPI0022E2D6C3|nr:multiple epidermal growth factor-like domains protein 10 isoform X1 [Mya arenaria]
MDFRNSFVIVYTILCLHVQETFQQATECRNCGCCAEGNYETCSSGYCNNGCIDGYWGTACYNKCNYNCLKCSGSDGYCSECKPGYFGRKCERPCGSRCSKCHKTYGCQSCKHGFWGNICNQQCNELCLGCRKFDGYCNDCVTGHYGSDCNSVCGSQCKYCNRLGGCITCHNGYYGSTCENTCGSYCSFCDKNLGCTYCSNDRFGNTCQYNCKSNCIHGACRSDKASCFCYSHFSGKRCQRCSLGFFGAHCSNKCSVGCNNECSEDNGFCTCKSGWSGDICDKCMNGFYGNSCSKRCRNKCEQCTALYECQSCRPGRSGSYCQYSCGKGCIHGICSISSSFCNCINEYFDETQHCKECVPGRNGQTCQQDCPTACLSCENESNCLHCQDGYYGIACQHKYPNHCSNEVCKQNNGSCFRCKDGYFGEHCNNACSENCQSCHKFGLCTECRPGFSNTNRQCTCRTDICVNPANCDSCTNTSFFANMNECCLCNLHKCVSCSNTLGTVNCKLCESGYFPGNNGQCEPCMSKCFQHRCDSSSGKCLKGCSNGYWNQNCEKECDPECSSCNQEDGLCSQCKNKTKHGTDCRLVCSTTCKDSTCDIAGYCTYGCITNTFGMQCENKCDDYCSPKDNITLCSERTGMCLHGCKTGYKGTFCPPVITTEAEQQPSSIASWFGNWWGSCCYCCHCGSWSILAWKTKRTFEK